MTATQPQPGPLVADRLGLTGIQHVGLTVRDQEASVAWYEEVLGLVRLFDEPHHASHAGGNAVVVGTPDMRLCIGLERHPSHQGERFDPTRTGLDHLSLLVATANGLDAWAEHLTARGVDHSGVYGIEGLPARFLTFRDPDGIQLELIAMQAA